MLELIESTRLLSGPGAAVALMEVWDVWACAVAEVDVLGMAAVVVEEEEIVADIAGITDEDEVLPAGGATTEEAEDFTEEIAAVESVVGIAAEGAVPATEVAGGAPIALISPNEPAAQRHEQSQEPSGLSFPVPWAMEPGDPTAGALAVSRFFLGG